MHFGRFVKKALSADLLQNVYFGGFTRRFINLFFSLHEVWFFRSFCWSCTRPSSPRTARPPRSGTRPQTPRQTQTFKEGIRRKDISSDALQRRLCLNVDGLIWSEFIVQFKKSHNAFSASASVKKKKLESVLLHFQEKNFGLYFVLSLTCDERSMFRRVRRKRKNLENVQTIYTSLAEIPC